MSSRPDDDDARVSAPLVRAENLRVGFGRPGTPPVVDGVSFELHAGRAVALVGESGSGKSVTARALVGLAGPGSWVGADALEVGGASVLGRAGSDGTAGGLSAAGWRRIRGRQIGLVLQDALVSLDPLRTIEREIGDALRLHTPLSAAGRRARVLDLLESVGMPDPGERMRQRSGELSGGLRQRALIASAIAADPPVLIADEPTTALDSTVQAQILDLFETLKARGAALLFISHDLAVVSRIADEVLVMRDGRVVESGPTDAVLGAPRHEYTRALLRAVPTGVPRFIRLSGSQSTAVTRSPQHEADSAASRGALEVDPADVRGSGIRNGAGEGAPRLDSIVAERGMTKSLQTGADEGAPRPDAIVSVRGATKSIQNGAGEGAPRLDAIVSVRGATKSFARPGGGQRVAVRDVSLEVVRGHTLGVVGQSGSGKTTLARIVLGLSAPDSGDVLLDGEPWAPGPERSRRPRRHRVGAVYQDALSSFDPRLTVEQILTDALRGRSGEASVPASAPARLDALLDDVGLPSRVRGARPIELSGGQRQRVSIARALAPRPDLIVCDEPVSALDVTIQAQVLDLFDELQQRYGLSYLFISHDLGVIQHMSDTIAVMHDGRVVEHGATADVFAHPESPYTQALLAAAPRFDASR